MPASKASNPDEVGFGVYIHWPFCASKCPYCDFNSHIRFGGIDEPRFLAAFQRELRTTRERIGPRAVTSIFIGGGTPSLMRPETVGGLLDEIARLWSVTPDAEVTLEANPSSVEAKAALEVARSTFERFSFDLIYARPGQTIEDWREELEEALGLAGGHLSLYQLTIEEGTPFASLYKLGKLQVPDGELAAALYELTGELTTKHGLPAYEVSNYAAPGEESRHNLLYWRYGEYAGIGPGAHGRLIISQDRVATMTEKAPERWLEAVETSGHGIVSTETLDRQEQADEALLMGLRLVEGLDLPRFERIGGVRPSARVIAELEEQGLLEWRKDPDRIAATTFGRMVLNELVLRLSESLEQV
jgi:oxygen-independent coproporphyrinogen-3 oxidase